MPTTCKPMLSVVVLLVQPSQSCTIAVNDDDASPICVKRILVCASVDEVAEEECCVLKVAEAV
jgi:hypothetical protein